MAEALARKPTTFEKLTLLVDAAKRIRQHAFISRASYNPNALPLPVMMTRCAENGLLAPTAYTVLKLASLLKEDVNTFYFGKKKDE